MPPPLDLTLAAKWKDTLAQLGRVRARGHDFFFFPPSRRSVWHASYHESGQRHLKQFKEIVRARGVLAREARQPPQELRGVETLVNAYIGMGNLYALPLCDRVIPPAVVLDADLAGFRDDAMFLRVFLLEPGGDLRIPNAVDVGPMAVQIVKFTRPWIGCALLQQRL